MALSSVARGVIAHLQAVQADPSLTRLDLKLLQDAEIYIGSAGILQEEIESWKVAFGALSQVLPVLQEDPDPLNRLALKVASVLSFEEISELDFTPGLALEAIPYHSLILSLLAKATTKFSDSERLAAKQETMLSVVKLWLYTDDIGTSTKASNLLLDLLKVSTNEPEALQTRSEQCYGRGPMWKRLFDDSDIYQIYYACCSETGPSFIPTPRSTKQRTISQVRLMDWLPRVGALSWETVARPHIPSIENTYGLGQDQGLIDFASRYMVNYRDDILMHISLIEFYMDLIKTVKKVVSQSNPNRSVSLNYMMQSTLHQRTINYWLKPDADSIDASFLTGPAASYISTFATHYPEEFEVYPEAGSIIEKLSETLQNVPPSQWTNSQSFANSNIRHDLRVLASVPRTILTPPRIQYGDMFQTPIASIPLLRNNADALNTLAMLFRGPETTPAGEPTTINTTSIEVNTSWNRYLDETRAARYLFFFYKLTYASKQVDLFHELVNLADTVAIKDVALAALNVIGSIIGSDWHHYPASEASEFHEQDSAQIRALKSIRTTGYETGVEIALDPTADTRILSYFLRAPKTFANLVGGHGEAENAAYEVASRKHEILELLTDRLAKVIKIKGDSWDDKRKTELTTLLSILQQRCREGIFPKETTIAAGSRIATLEL